MFRVEEEVMSAKTKKISLVSFRGIDRLVYPGPPVDAIVLEVSPIVILSLFSDLLMAIS